MTSKTRHLADKTATKSTKYSCLGAVAEAEMSFPGPSEDLRFRSVSFRLAFPPDSFSSFPKSGWCVPPAYVSACGTRVALCMTEGAARSPAPRTYRGVRAVPAHETRSVVCPSIRKDAFRCSCPTPAPCHRCSLFSTYTLLFHRALGVFVIRTLLFLD